MVLNSIQIPVLKRIIKKWMENVSLFVIFIHYMTSIHAWPPITHCVSGVILTLIWDWRIFSANWWANNDSWYIIIYHILYMISNFWVLNFPYMTIKFKRCIYNVIFTVQPSSTWMKSDNCILFNFEVEIDLLAYNERSWTVLFSVRLQAYPENHITLV